MKLKNLTYRLAQKWAYHTSSNTFFKQVAELNKFQKVIDTKSKIFHIIGYNTCWQSRLSDNGQKRLRF